MRNLAFSLDPSVIKYMVRYFTNLPYQQKKEIIEKNPDKIQYIIDPSEQIQLVSIKKDPTAIKYIQNPTEKVQLLVIKKDFNLYKYIHNPTEKVLLLVVEKDPKFLKYNSDLTEKVQLKAVKQDIFNIQYIQDPTEKVQLLVIKKDPTAIKYIQNPTEKVKIAAVQKDPSLIKYIKNPTKEIQILAGKTIEIPFRDYMPNYSLSNKDIAIKVENGKLTVTNNTKEFMQVISLSEYLDKDIFSYNPFKVSPDGIYTVNIARLNTLKLNKLRNRILFGYAIEYKVGNKPAKNLYKTFDYIYTIKGNDIYIKRAK